MIMRSALVYSLFVVFLHGINSLEFLNNGLAKVCHPVDNSLDLLFILDGSGGSRTTFDSQLTALTKVVEMVEIGDNSTQIAVMQYGTYTYMEFLFNAYTDKESMFAAIQNIRHKSGTTRTGKALDKAFEVFHDDRLGARKGRSDVVIIISDGHSRDDPVPAATRLRQAGVRVLSLGIGPHINVDELVAIAGTPEFVFQNLTDEGPFQRFMETFEKFTMGEQCEFARGKNGADIRCNPDSISISVSTSKPLHGHLFVEGRFSDRKCVARSNTSEVTLKVGLIDCGIKRQFSINPKGFIFETRVLLQFHPDYSTAIDKAFDVRCFYSDSQKEEDETEIDWQLVQSVRNRRKNLKDEVMPCKYTLTKKDMKGCKTANNITTVDDRLLHKWECNPDNYDTYQSFLIHSCFVVDIHRNLGRMIIDEHGDDRCRDMQGAGFRTSCRLTGRQSDKAGEALGIHNFSCSMETEIISTPFYDSELNAHSESMVIHHPDSPLFRMKCSIKFCDRLMSECDSILPPRCGDETIVRKRQAGFPISIRPLNGKSVEKSVEREQKATTPRLITFKRRKSGKKSHLKKKTKLAKKVIPKSVNTIKENSIGSKKVIIAKHSIKKSSKEIISSQTKKSKEMVSISSEIQDAPVLRVTIPKITPLSSKSSDVSNMSNSTTDSIMVKTLNDKVMGANVKLNTQDVRVISASSEEKRGINAISKELDANVIKQMSSTEFQIESDTITISNNESCMKKIKT